MMRPALATLALCAALLAGGVGAFLSERKASSGKEQRKVPQASWDEVNVIAHGLLQLGHGLKEHVDKTKGQLKEMSGKLGAHNSTLGELVRQARRAQEEGEALRGRVQELESRDSQLDNISRSLQGKVQELSRGRAGLDQRLDSIEDRVQRALEQPRAREEPREDLLTVQSLMEAQNKRIDELLEKIKLQQYKLDKQNLQIKSLQSKIQDNKTLSPLWRSILRKKTKHLSQSQNISFDQAEELPSDCHQIFLGGERTSGTFSIQPLGSQPIQVFCKITADGGWTVIQRRIDGSVDFDQTWEAYRNGFGDLSGEFWLGLENMYAIAAQGKYILRIDLQDWEETSQSIELDFSLGGQDTGYALQVQGRVSGDLENAVGDVQPLPFSTRDHDQDLKSDLNCAKHLSGGWWFSSCGHANLNGKYFRTIPRQRHERKQGIFWKTWRGRYYPLKSTTIRIRPAEVEP